MTHRILALAAALACMAGLAQASTLRIEATGGITFVGSAFPGSFSAGQSASLIWDIDTSVAASFSDPPFSALYPATTFVSMTFNGQTYSDSFAGNVVDVGDGNGSIPDQLGDQLSPFDVTFAGVSGLRYQVLVFGTDDFVDGVSLTQTFDPAELVASSFRLIASSGDTSTLLQATFDTATFTTAPIPAPAALPLLLTALAGLGLLRRRRRAV